MVLLICWLVFPALLGALSLGCGLLAERIAGVRIPGALLLPVGLAAIIVTAQFAVTTDQTAELAMPAVVVLAVTGLVLSRPWVNRRPDWWATVAALAVFASFAAPVVLSGKATWAGYLRLDDTAAWFAITDHVMEHGRGLGSLAPSSYEGYLRLYFPTGYPVGTFLPLGVGRALVGQDVAWVFQPYIAFIAAMLGLALYELAARVISPPQLRASAVFLAAQPAILFGYTLVGGVKEVLTAALLALLAALALAGARSRAGVRALIPLAIVIAAAVDAVSFGAAFWLLPLLAAALVVAIRLHGARSAFRRAGALAVLTGALSLASLPALADFLGSSPETLTSGSQLGTLVKPLSPLQVFGIWPVGDFRVTPDDLFAADVLIVVLIAGGLAGLALAWRSKAWEPILYLGAAGVGWLVTSLFGAPWVDAKAIAIASPAFVLVGLVGAAAAVRLSRFATRSPIAPAVLGGVITGLVGGAIAFGVLWSNVLAYHNVNLAPRERYHELQRIGDRIAGQGPTLATEFDFYGPRHFLRKGDPQGAPVRWGRRPLPLVDGGTLDEGEYRDIDKFRFDGLRGYKNLVLARSPTASRPPSAYRLAWSGRFYELWQRDERRSSRILAHLPLGGVSHRRRAKPGGPLVEEVRTPVGRPSCREVLRMARLPGTRRLATVRRPPPLLLNLRRLTHPKSWVPDPVHPGSLFPLSSGELGFSMQITQVAQDRYGFWLGNAFRRRLELSVDGRRIAARTHELQVSGQFVPMGEVSLVTGMHSVLLRYGDATLRPGSGSGFQPVPLGPLVLSAATADRPVSYLSPSKARSLCGQKLDWIEALGA